jgi:hypothetical protein
MTLPNFVMQKQYREWPELEKPERKPGFECITGTIFPLFPSRKRRSLTVGSIKYVHFANLSLRVFGSTTVKGDTNEIMVYFHAFYPEAWYLQL